MVRSQKDGIRGKKIKLNKEGGKGVQNREGGIRSKIKSM